MYCVASGQYHVCKFDIVSTNSPKAFTHVNARNQAKFVQRHVYLIKDKTECNVMHNLAIVSTGARVASCEGDTTADIECKLANGFKIITCLSDCQPDEIKISEVDFYSDQDQDAVKVTVEADAMPPLHASQRTTHYCLSKVGVHTDNAVNCVAESAVTRDKDQCECKSRCAFSSTGRVETTDSLLPLSEQQLIDRSRQNSVCNGGI